MLYAIERGRRRRARPRHRARCPTCRAVMLAKCGEHVIWHWAHQSVKDCDDWKGGETRWHLEWKQRFPAECVEVWRAGRRADVLLDDGTVIEFQRGGLSADEVRAREAHWGRQLIWVVYAHGLTEGDYPRLDLRPHDYGLSFRWKHAMRSWSAARRSVLLDLDADDHRLFELKKTHWKLIGDPESVTGGWGRYVELGWQD